MKILKLLSIAFLTITLFNCKGEKKEKTDTETSAEIEEKTNVTETEEKSEEIVLEIKLEPKSDSKVSGAVTFTEKDGMVTMAASLTGLSEGTHAIHIHEKADCSSADGKSTGGHWNPTLEPHGKWGADEGYHRGDIGNFKANADGNGSITFATNEWCIGCGNEKENILGKAIIVHQGEDDYKTQPTGAAGGRVSCGAIIQ